MAAYRRGKVGGTQDGSTAGNDVQHLLIGNCAGRAQTRVLHALVLGPYAQQQLEQRNGRQGVENHRERDEIGHIWVLAERSLILDLGLKTHNVLR